MNLIVQKQLSPTAVKYLKDDFIQMYNNLAIADLADSHFDSLCNLYRQKQRHYHNLSHIYNFVQLSNQLVSHLKYPDLFKVAIWLHDAIYVAHNKDNEWQSKLLFDRMFAPFFTQVQLDYVSDLIRSTARHLPQNKQPDCFYFLDFDLAILAATPSVYQSYAVAVWKEYQTTYPKPIYKMGRKKVLKAFLERDFIYYTSLYQKKFEGIARKNIQFELNT